HPVRAAVNVELHRVLAARIEIGRRDVPTLDLHAVARCVPYLCDAPEFPARQDVVVDSGELLDVGRSLEIEADDIAGLRRGRENADSLALAADVRHAEDGRALRAGRHSPAGCR